MEFHADGSNERTYGFLHDNEPGARDLEFVVIYIDDIAIFSETLEDHIIHIREVLKRLQDANIKINIDKCNWISTKIKMLGHYISETGIEMDKSKIEAIEKRTAPTTVKQLQQFLGMANYYRKFIKNFSAIASPLYALLSDNTIWSWDENCEKAFQDIKKALTLYPILRQPDMRQQFIINVDASNEAVGAVLSQLDDQNNEYAIAYASKSFRSYEKHMSISEKEMAACVFGVNEFRPYIFGTKFKIVTDHNALKYLMSIKNPTGKLARWSMYRSLQRNKSLKCRLSQQTNRNELPSNKRRTNDFKHETRPIRRRTASILLKIP